MEGQDDEPTRGMADQIHTSVSTELTPGEKAHQREYTRSSEILCQDRYITSRTTHCKTEANQKTETAKTLTNTENSQKPKGKRTDDTTETNSNQAYQKCTQYKYPQENS